MDCSRMWHMRKPNKVRLKYWPITDFVWASSHFANTNKYLMCACVVTWQKTHRQSPTHSNVTLCYAQQRDVVLRTATWRCATHSNVTSCCAQQRDVVLRTATWRCATHSNVTLCYAQQRDVVLRTATWRCATHSNVTLCCTSNWSFHSSW